MSPEPRALAELRRRAAELADLNGVGGLLLWDQNTMMPPGGAGARADQFEALERILHDRMTDPALAKLLDELEPWARDEDPDSDAVALVRNLRRDHHKAVNVPTDLAAEISSAAAHAQQAWMEARDAQSFAVFRPALEKVLELQARYVACFDGTGEYAHPYDILLDDYEPGLTTAELKGLFAQIQDELVPLVSAAAAAGEDGRVFSGTYATDKQQALAMELLHAVGFEDDHWRLDATVHPFARSMAHTDVRLTTRWEPDDLAMALYSSLHEFGHGLYEAQMDPRHYRTTLADATGLGVHESQSRLWENLVGRSRPFCAWFLPLLQRHLGAPFDAQAPADLYRAVNQVRLSLVRIEADETTYNLHIALRFELELALVEGRLAVADLPDAWDEATHRLLGLETPSVLEGVLQDIHWGAGMIGYFPTYTIGNLMAAQLWAALRADLPEVEDAIAAGDFAPLRDWLREHVHRHGRKFTSRELLRRATGEELQVEPFLRYLEAKLVDAGLLTEPVRGARPAQP
jgi:carboxypeptidase Taq